MQEVFDSIDDNARFDTLLGKAQISRWLSLPRKGRRLFQLWGILMMVLIYIGAVEGLSSEIVILTRP